MATVRDLKQSITQMSQEEALKVIVRCRDSRRTPKVVVKTNKRITTNKKRVIDPFAVVKAMSAEQKAQLRKELLGE